MKPVHGTAPSALGALLIADEALMGPPRANGTFGGKVAKGTVKTEDGALLWFLRVAMFRQVQDGLPPETTKVIDTVIEIDLERNPLTARAFAKAKADSKLEERRDTIARLLEDHRELTAAESGALKGMDKDDLDSAFEATLALVRDPSNDEALRSLDAVFDGSVILKP